MADYPQLVTNPDDHEPNGPPPVVPKPIPPNLVRLTGIHTTPELCLQLTQQHLPRLRAVVVVMEWDDGSHQVTWSRQPNSSFAVAALLLNRTAQDVLMGDDLNTTLEPPIDEPA